MPHKTKKCCFHSVQKDFVPSRSRWIIKRKQNRLPTLVIRLFVTSQKTLVGWLFEKSGKTLTESDSKKQLRHMAGTFWSRLLIVMNHIIVAVLSWLRDVDGIFVIKHGVIGGKGFKQYRNGTKNGWKRTKTWSKKHWVMDIFGWISRTMKKVTHFDMKGGNSNEVEKRTTRHHW